MSGKAGFNLSKWALEHAALTRYLMIAFTVLGFASYFQLGQDEDPPFTFRIMVMRTYWPGATAQQMAEQVTDKLERTLQEAPYADKIRSYSKPGESMVIFQIKDSSKPGEVANVWYTVRKKIGDMRGTLPGGVQGPFFNDEFGDVYGVIYALQTDGYSQAEIKTFADEVRQGLLRVKDVAKVEQFGLQDEKIYVEVSQKRVAQLGLERGGAQGLESAARWFGVAAQRGSSEAMFRLANAYRAGAGVRRDAARAVALYEQAGQSEHAGALQALAMAHLHGELGLTPDEAEHRRYMKAAEHAILHHGAHP